MRWLTYSSTTLLVYAFRVAADCCTPTDIQDSVTPILIAPNSDEYFCSDIATNPDGADIVSTCNVPGDELRKSSMWSGNWIVIIEGLTFAWMRSLDIIAGPPATVTNTATVTFSVTQTPSTTVTTTFTTGFTTTLTPATVTVPSTTSTRTITVRPSQVTVSVTTTSTRTRTDKVYSKTATTTTVTTSCRPQLPKRDPTCTLRPTKASLAAATVIETALARVRRIDKTIFGSRRFHGISPRRVDGGLAKRAQGPGSATFTGLQRFRRLTGPDKCTTTVLDTETVVTSMVTFTAPTSTELVSETTSTTVTITPPPVTAYSGKAKVTTTVTASTPTRTRVVRVYTTSWTSTTIWATITSTITTHSPGVVCATSRA
ncbi:hypothetical protein B0A52_00079 [Exophiala mesophila]|uniref:Ig-like domain-containing protein n=1 Tax=Exophiala mesophila TaxID=212818 RepID=A0A438NJ14_EXOME|nr:hypothetical protein B0A52_00079 [Exophiala mesophila]